MKTMIISTAIVLVLGIMVCIFIAALSVVLGVFIYLVSGNVVHGLCGGAFIFGGMLTLFIKGLIGILRES